MISYTHFAQGAWSWITRTAGCTWTAGATGVAATTGGAKNPTPDLIHNLVKSSEETSPRTPGWSIPDLKLALSRYGMTLVDRSGRGWADVVAQLDDRHYVVLQGDSDQFGNSTCSGTFNGDHAVGVHPRRRIYGNLPQRWIDDPVCLTGRWEFEHVLRRYAEKLNPRIQYGAFLAKVPADQPAYRVHVRADYAFFRYLLPLRRSRMSPNGFTAACTAPARRLTPWGWKRLITVTSGAYKGWVLDADNHPPVTVSED